MASLAKDHEREQDFFAKALKAKRFYETMDFQGLVTSILYQKVSNFGHRIFRPLWALVGVWLVFGLGYKIFATGPTATVWDGSRLSPSVIMPFSASARKAFEYAQAALFMGPAHLDLWFDVSIFIEGLLSLTCVFFVGLALRHRLESSPQHKNGPRMGAAL